jgi:hypothetical protein
MTNEYLTTFFTGISKSDCNVIFFWNIKMISYLLLLLHFAGREHLAYPCHYDFKQTDRGSAGIIPTGKR